MQRRAGDYPAAAASQRQVVGLCRQIGNRLGQAWALDELGMVQQLTGDYPAAARSHQQALKMFGDLGHQLGVAHALNSLSQQSPAT